MTNKEKFLKLVSNRKTTTLDNLNFRIENEDGIKQSQEIAIKVLLKLKELKMSQRELATLMNVKPQQITKLVSGRQNLTIFTLKKVEKVLNIIIFECDKSKEVKGASFNQTIFLKPVKMDAPQNNTKANYTGGNVIELPYQYTSKKAIN
jgi:transcriptional regulator with XRE-family HTH domain